MKVPVLLASLLFTFGISAIDGYQIKTDRPDHTAFTGTIEGVVQLAAKSRVVRSGGGLYGRPGRVSQGTAPEDSVLIVLTGTTGAEASMERVYLNQKDRRFIPDILPVYPGQTVRIQNSDPVYHNVFSLTSPHKFDVGRRPKGEHFDVAFEKPGVVDVFCDIHSNMYAIIYVLPPNTISWTKVKSGDPFSFPGLEEGMYELRVYAKGYKEGASSVSVTDGNTTQTGMITLNL